VQPANPNPDGRVEAKPITQTYPKRGTNRPPTTNPKPPRQKRTVQSTTPAQITGSSQTRILANHPTARQAAAELLTAASEGKLVISVPDVGGTVLYQQTNAGHARLTDDHVRLASVLTGGKYPLLRARKITPPITLGDGQHLGTHRLAATEHAQAALRSPTLIYLPPVYEIRAVKPEQAALVPSDL
jgi:hypothetical protein